MPPTVTLGIAHQRHCAQHHRHHYRLCVEEEGKGKGPCGSLCCGLSFPPPAPVVPCLVMCSRSPPLAKARGLAWGGQLRMTYDCLLEREAWLWVGGGGAYHGGGGLRRADAAPYMHLCLEISKYLYPSRSLCISLSLYLSIPLSTFIPMSISMSSFTFISLPLFTSISTAISNKIASWFI